MNQCLPKQLPSQELFHQMLYKGVSSNSQSFYVDNVST